MRINSLKVENYRTLHNANIDFSKEYCTISGRNNAGKSCIIQLLSKLFQPKKAPWILNDLDLDFALDRTQWAKAADKISITYFLEILRQDDAALYSFIEKISNVKIESDRCDLVVKFQLNKDDQKTIEVKYNENLVGETESKEIVRKIRDLKSLFLHNSTNYDRDYMYFGRSGAYYDFAISSEEKKRIVRAQNELQNTMRRLARGYTKNLADMLGRLSEKYDVEASALEGYTLDDMPLGINLKDKNVEVPLNEWGSGTQNKAHVLMAILQAHSRKKSSVLDERIAPVVVIEEPESFLHPSAQAEFGGMLKNFSDEFGVQIIVTTHSPYMLNKGEPTANILLKRREHRGKLYETHVIEVVGDNWMAPFADQLGINPSDFKDLAPIFAVGATKVLLVEGQLDVEYFKILQSGNIACECLRNDVEIVSYGGKDALKNTILIQFLIRRIENVFITFDLDALKDVSAPLARLSLKQSVDFLPIGVNQPGKDCIEGVLPESVLARVNGRETDLIMKLGSNDRNKAKNDLKAKYLSEFKSRSDYTASELKEFDKITKIINRKFALK